MLKAIASDSLSTALGQLLQRKNFWLSCCVVSDMSNSLRLHPDPREPERPQADTRRVVCACTHYLVFKEPTAGRHFRDRPLEPTVLEGTLTCYPRSLFLSTTFFRAARFF